MENLAAGVEGTDIRTLAVSVDEDWDVVKRFFARGTRLGVLLDTTQGKCRRTSAPRKYPETYFIDAQGRVRHYFINKRDWSRPEVDRLPGEPAVEAVQGNPGRLAFR